MQRQPFSVEAVAQQLTEMPLFSGLSAADRQAVVTAADIIEVAAGDAITREGDRADGFFVLLSGEGAVYVGGEGGAPPLEAGIIRPGEAFGELGALLGEPRTATVIAESHCRLLRLDAARLESLFKTLPSFAVAFSRELARRLREAFAIKNGLQVDNLPDRVVMDVPELTRLREYMVSYYTTALKHVLKHHRLIVDRRFPTYETTFVLSAPEQQRWLDLFETTDVTTPFTYHTSVGTMMLMRLVGDVGVNFKNLMHLKSEMRIAPSRPMQAGKSYRLVFQIEDIIALREDRVALVCASRVYDGSGNQVRSYRDFFIILNLEPEYITALRDTKAYGRHDASEFEGLAKREASLHRAADVKRVMIDVPGEMGLSYGKVSGDLNLVHTTPLAAKLFGHPRVFVQGLCTANYVLRHLTAAHGVPEELRITFAKRVFVGQQVQLCFTSREFEICDSNGALLAFGDYALPSID